MNSVIGVPQLNSNQQATKDDASFGPKRVNSATTFLFNYANKAPKHLNVPQSPKIRKIDTGISSFAPITMRSILKTSISRSSITNNRRNSKTPTIASKASKGGGLLGAKR